MDRKTPLANFWGHRLATRQLWAKLTICKKVVWSLSRVSTSCRILGFSHHPNGLEVYSPDVLNGHSLCQSCGLSVVLLYTQVDRTNQSPLNGYLLINFLSTALLELSFTKYSICKGFVWNCYCFLTGSIKIRNIVTLYASICLYFELEPGHSIYYKIHMRPAKTHMSLMRLTSLSCAPEDLLYLYATRILWSDCVDAHVDLSLRWAQRTCSLVGNLCPWSFIFDLRSKVV